MTDPIATGARAAANRLTAPNGPALAAEVEAALHVRATTSRPVQYIDPVSLGALIVSIAGLTWTVYRDLRKTTPAPSPEVVARHVRVRLDRDSRPPGPELDAADRDQVIEIVIEETVRSAEYGDSAPDGN
ncbi:hypothetical protein [Streptomyces iconiensis]|uniref:Uncharacterized protein n=1 Tax=Streptomyces iconiensis TaxID=1384038 RepID=A0ABT7A287_9ACTN|nr:hypothetical protein [Streptomyces iconiensis]MDJ1135454.1 hypothetical protein [Streptomyces iconiensis]